MTSTTRAWVTRSGEETEALGAYMKREYETWGRVVKEAGIQAE